MELEQALRTVIEYLDGLMVSNPSRELADVSNYLEKLIEEIE
jgi:hypothetical protein